MRFLGNTFATISVIAHQQGGTMDINVKTAGPVTVVEIVGDIDGKTAPQVQTQVLPLVQPGSRILMDMTHVDYMSSAGLRMLLSTYRTASGAQAQVMLAGLSEEIQDTMSATGFIGFFTLYDTVGAALEGLG
jgi:anti-sigma B factor antagonist